MCVTPRLVYQAVSGQWRAHQVACRYCWQCKANRVWDWVGRAIAENETCTKAFFVTLTYGNTNRYGELLDSRATSLHYPDVQKWLKRIRLKHRVRYIVTGEYGPLKGRAHWHALLFFYGALPDIKLDYKYWGNREFNTDPFWKDGQTQWKAFSPSHAKYVTKYMLKAEEGKLSMAMLSKKPPLGHDYFMQRAERYVQQGLSPQDLEYKFPEVTYGKKNRDPRVFVLQGVSRDNFLSHFIDKWREKHGKDNWPYSEVIEEYLDSLDTPEVEERRLLAEQVEKRRRRANPHSLDMPWFVPKQEQSFPEPELPCKLYVDRRLNLWACSDPSTPWRAPRYWSFDENGFSGWHEKPNLVTEAKASKLRAEFASRLPQPDWSPERKAARGPK